MVFTQFRGLVGKRFCELTDVIHRLRTTRGWTRGVLDAKRQRLWFVGRGETCESGGLWWHTIANNSKTTHKCDALS